MLRDCILVLSNSFYNEFFRCKAEIIALSEEVTKYIQTYQQRLFVDTENFNYRPNEDFDLVFGLCGDDNSSFVEELGISFSDDDNQELQEFISLKQELEQLHGLFVTKGINSVVTVYFNDK